jgi:hypothetical protein
MLAANAAENPNTRAPNPGLNMQTRVILNEAKDLWFYSSS